MVHDVPRVYVSCAGANRLFQGEVLCNVIERQVADTGNAEEPFGLLECVHPYAVIVSQDCDLEQDARARGVGALDPQQRENALVPHVLFLVASEFENAKGRMGTSRQRERVRQNKDERFHYLSPVLPELDARGVGIPPLLLDFKRFFTFPTDQLYRRLERGEASRGARLETPYAEHLGVRFGFFLQRVGLMKEHHDIASPASATEKVPEQG